MQLVIFCGGLATRLGPLAKDTPKSMIRIEGKPFLQYQIELAKQYGITDIVLCVGYLSDHIETYFGDGKKFGVQLRYSHDGETPLGPIGALKQATPLLDDIFFIMYGDSYVFVDFRHMYNTFLKQQGTAMMTVYKNKDKYDDSNLIIKHGHVIRCGKDKKTKDMTYIDYGVSLLRKSTLSLIPDKTRYATVPFFCDLVNQNQLLAYKVTKRFYHIGTPQALEEFTRYIKKQQH